MLLLVIHSNVTGSIGPTVDIVDIMVFTLSPDEIMVFTLSDTLRDSKKFYVYYCICPTLVVYSASSKWLDFTKKKIGAFQAVL